MDYVNIYNEEIIVLSYSFYKIFGLSYDFANLLLLTQQRKTQKTRRRLRLILKPVTQSAANNFLLKFFSKTLLRLRQYNFLSTTFSIYFITNIAIVNTNYWRTF